MSEYQKFNNLQEVFKRIYYSKENLSRAKIAKTLSLSRTTVSSLVNEMIDKELVCELELEDHKNGRPGVLLSMNKNVWYAIGAAYEAQAWRFSIVNLQNQVVYENYIEVADNSSKSALDTLLTGLVKTINCCPGKLLPKIGIGVPGYIDQKTGVIISASDVGWKGVKVAETVKKKLGLPSIIINRHHAAAIAEARIGEGKDVNELMYIGISTGAIASHVSKGQLVIGDNYNGGEIGHTVVDLNGPLCSCGKHGCLQAVVSENALLSNIAMRYKVSTPSKEDAVTDALKSGRPLTLNDVFLSSDSEICEEELSRVVNYLGMVCSNLINMFNPDLVVIGSTMARVINQKNFDSLNACIKRYSIPHPYDLSQLRYSSLGLKADSIGSAMLILDQTVSLVV